MRRLLLITVLLVFLASCKKEIREQETGLLSSVKAFLKDNLSTKDYGALDFSKAVNSFLEKEKVNLVRISFTESKITERFIAVKADVLWNCSAGKIIQISGSADQSHFFNGSVRIYSLQGQLVLESPIEKGIVKSFHAAPEIVTRNSGILSHDNPYETLPEVVVVGYRSSSGGDISWSTWMSVMSFLDNAPPTGDAGGYYNALDPITGTDGNESYGGNIGSDGGMTSDPSIYVDFEQGYYQAAINLDAYLKCFGNIPDAGASCSITIFSDVPVDNDPYKIMDWEVGSPGHTFIEIKKSNGGQHVQQSFGFYPVSGWKTALTPAPINGKFVDNGGHEFNGSLRMDISPAGLQRILTHMQYLARFVRYDIDEYNCTDWALDIFNQVRTDILEIPRYHLPGGQAPSGTGTPQGLYQQLQAMKQAGGPEANNITIDIIKGWVGSSTGPCQ